MRALVLLVVLVAACDYPRSLPIGGDDTPIDADPSAPDADPNAPDADPSAIDAAPGCIPGNTQCTNCIDDDGDDEIDGDDLECTSAHDNDEGSFETGIPMDNSGNQDCYFDNNSGSGDDGCSYPRCCSDGSCPGDQRCIDPQPQICTSFCPPLTVPGCDCFGCCTVCQGASCYNVSFNPALSPDCAYQRLDDPSACAPCIKYAGCGVPCGAAQCILCHGQEVADLAAACGGVRTCPAGFGVCETTADCGTNQWCGNGCCLAVVQ